MEPIQIGFIAVMGIFVLAVIGDDLRGLFKDIPWQAISVILGISSLYLGLRNAPLQEVVSASVLQTVMGDVGGYNPYIVAGVGFTAIGLISAYLHYK